MEGIRKGGMRMQIVFAFIVIGMIAAAGVHQFPGPQDGAAVLTLAVTVGGSRGACGQLLAHPLGQGQATAGARIAVGAANAADLLGFRGIRLGLEEVRMVFDPGRFGRFGPPIGRLLGRLRGAEFFAQAMGGDGIVRSRRGIIGGGIGMVGVALRTGERENLGAYDRGRAMHLAEMRQRELEREHQLVESRATGTGTATPFA